ncbi:MAG: N-acetyltransferase family protein [Saprospiraceae bacterium]
MLTFNTATLTDAPAIAAIHTLNWQQNYRGAFSDEYLDHQAAPERLKVWTGRLQQSADHQHIITVKENDKLIGFSCLMGNDDPIYGTLLDNLHVGAGQKGRGLGRQLLERSLDWSFKNYPQQPMYLWVLTQNEKGIRFYERLGGKRVEQAIHHSPLGKEVTVYRYVWYS